MSKPENALQPFDIVDHFRIIKNIGHGGFGDIYLVRDINSNTPYALKLEKNPSGRVLIETEYQILKKLQGSLSFPRVSSFGTVNNSNYLVMELLGPSLNKVRVSQNGHKLSLSTALRAGIEMICILRELHFHGFIHRDINANNFLIRPSSPVPLCLIDFGLSISFLGNSGEFLSQSQTSSFIGTPRYASLNAHRKQVLGPCDDLISWFFSMIELISGDLPWSIHASRSEIMRMKDTIEDDDLCSGVPDQFKEIYKELSSLKCHDEPDYDLIINHLSEAMKENGITSNEPYDWETLPERVSQSISPFPMRSRKSDALSEEEPPQKVIKEPSTCVIIQEVPVQNIKKTTPEQDPLLSNEEDVNDVSCCNNCCLSILSWFHKLF